MASAGSAATAGHSAGGPGGAHGGPPSGPPYAPEVQGYGGVPTVIPDIPLSAIYLFLYIAAAACHMGIFQMNKKKGNLFVMSAMTFGFSMCRIITFCLRIAWAKQPRNVNLAIAANIFVMAGTPILYIINLIFAHRIIRAQHPKLGWHRALSILARLIVASIVIVLCMLIIVSVVSAYTLNTNTHRIVRDIQLFGTTFYTLMAFLPLPMVIVGLVIPRRIRTEKFGKGRFRTKFIVLMSATFLLTFRAVWGTTTSYLPGVPRTKPLPFYYGKAAFYTVQLLTELLVVLLYAFVRVDRRFYTPTGQRNSYLALPGTGPNAPPIKPPEDLRPRSGQSMTLRFYTEEELFDDCQSLANTLRYSSTSLALDDKSGTWQFRQHSVSSLYAPSFVSTSANGDHSTRNSLTAHGISAKDSVYGGYGSSTRDSMQSGYGRSLRPDSINGGYGSSSKSESMNGGYPISARNSLTGGYVTAGYGQHGQNRVSFNESPRPRTQSFTSASRTTTMRRGAEDRLSEIV